MKVLDILAAELNEMAVPVKERKEVISKMRKMIDSGDVAGAAKLFADKGGVNFTKEFKEAFSQDELEQIKAARQNLAKEGKVSATSKRGPGAKASKSKESELVKAASGDKTGKTATANQSSIKKKIEDKIRKTARQIMDDDKLSDKEKEEHLAGLEIMGQALNVTRSGKGIIGKEVSDKSKQIARRKLEKNSPEVLKRLKQLEKEMSDEKQEYEELAKEWKNKTGKTPEQSIDNAISKGILRFRADSTIPKDKDDEEDTPKKGSSLKDQILGNSRSNK